MSSIAGMSLRGVCRRRRSDRGRNVRGSAEPSGRGQSQYPLRCLSGQRVLSKRRSANFIYLEMWASLIFILTGNLFCCFV